MINLKTVVSVLAVLIISIQISGQTRPANAKQAKPNDSRNVQFFPLSELKEGMRGTAYTVFRGTEPEEFNVEILGVVPGAIGPKQDLIVGRISGGSADRTSVFAGMSGSPVYIDGKLVGAISYSFPFSKEPVCGITPIEQMVTIFEHNEEKNKSESPRKISFAELASTKWTPDLTGKSSKSSLMPYASDSSSPLMAVAGQAFQPIGTPVTFSGFNQETLNRFAPQLMQIGLLPVSAAGGAARITKLKEANEQTLTGGSSVSMQLTRGDFSLAASGTVTFRDGEKVYAFGHPFLSLGSADLPMAESHVVTVIPSINNSFKLAVPEAMVGSMTQDRATGVYGKLGRSPQMIPVRLNFKTSRNQLETYNYEVVKDDFLTPLLLNITVNNAITANERGLGESTIELKGEVRIKDQEPIKFERRFAGMQAAQSTGVSIAIPVSAVLKSRFDGIEITEVNLEITSTDGSNTGVLERIALDRTQVRAGETFEVQAYVRTESGKIFVQKVPVRVPMDTPSGTLMVAVGDGNSIQQSDVSQEFIPKSLSELIRTINEVKKNDRLYVQTFRVTKGAVIGAKELPNLPPSVLATLNNDRSAGGFKPTVQTVVTEQEIPPAEFVITGQQTLAIEVIK